VVQAELDSGQLAFVPAAWPSLLDSGLEGFFHILPRVLGLQVGYDGGGESPWSAFF
jgi:hypothetical protein